MANWPTRRGDRDTWDEGLGRDESHIYYADPIRPFFFF